MERYYWAAFRLVPGFGNSRIKSLVSFFGSAQTAWKAARRDLFLCGCLDVADCNNLLAEREKIDVHKIAQEWDKKGIRLCRPRDSEYPALLNKIFDPPEVLFYRGQLPVDQQLVGIVGARRASAYGKNAASFLASHLASAGFGVISGAARGIDTAAHNGALEHGRTFAVLGSGVDICYPAENKRLLDKIVEQGAVISEHPPGTPPLPGFFPARNRIISGMSRGVVVVEAAEKSGALITADFALEEGRDVFAVPGSIFSETSKGSHRLLKQGAKLVERPEDILEEYGMDGASKPSNSVAYLSEEESILYKELSYENPLSVDEIILKTNMAPQIATYILLQLELRNLVAQSGGQRYIRLPGREIG